MSSTRDKPSHPRKRQSKATNGSASTAFDASTQTENDKDIISKAGRITESRNDMNASWVAIARGVVFSAVPAWVNMGIMVTLIFGGCCANVFALEAIIKDEPGSGALITFTQFVICALLTLPYFLSFSAGPRSFFLAPRAIPLKSWVIYTAFFMTVNLLNNAAFAYRISVPLHIILRSAGPVASMIIGYLYNSKVYTRTQVLAVGLLTVGVAAAALADAQAQGKPLELGLSADTDASSLATFVTGFMILALAMILSAFQGVYADRLYETHGRSHWKEALFYSHTISLPFFIPTYSKVAAQMRALVMSPPALSALATSANIDSFLSPNSTSSILAASATAAPFSSSPVQTVPSLLSSLANYPIFHSILSQTPIKVVYLLMNALTQYLCIRGVHLLSAQSSSLTVTIVLNIRKLVSLVLSIYIFGNVLATGVLVGAVVVFVGGGIYGFEGARLRNRKQKSG
ncbi:golgi uridine diphosphate-N- acetylglucosamine transporter [Arachnomyces sp. PD_36]|nr:golgi uridine diphosphate-N- acetylglucosamine transporter [Arachnomyces sp. PD_36]